MKTIHFDTTRPYSPDGKHQRISATLYAPGERGLPADGPHLITFYDHDRRIDGEFRTERPETAFTESGIMRRYDASDYASGEAGWHDMRKGGNNSVWVDPAKAEKPKLPPRRAAGLSLTYEGGDLYVTSFGYSASLLCASDLGVLHHDRTGVEKNLGPKQQAVVSEWMDHYDDYFEANGWKTWADINE